MTRRINKSAGSVLATLSLIVLIGGFGVHAEAAANPVPYIVNISPVTVAPGGAQFNLTVNGANFVNGSTVVWGTHQGTQHLVTTFVSSDQLTATVPAAEVANAGTASITVQNSGAALSNPAYLAVTLPAASLAFRRTTQSPSGGNHPNVPIIGDFNGDGIPDMAVSNNQSTGSQVSVFLGIGSGSFSGATNYTAASACGAGGTAPCDPEGMLAGDFNGDGYLDLAVANRGDATITVLLGSASGTFSVLSPTTTGSQPYVIAAADFNRDGKLDLVVACQGPLGGPGFVDILLGNNDGTFAAPVQYGSIGLPEGIALGDFNGDGFLDVAVSDFNNNEIWLLTGNGDGTFSSGIAYTTAQEPAGLVANDFNGDGYTDLAVADLMSNAVSVLLNSKTSSTFLPHVEFPVAGGGYFLGSADLTGSGTPSVAVADYSSNVFSSLFGNGDGTFQSYASYSTDPSANSVFGLALADLNADGRYDVVTTDAPDDLVEVLLQTATLNPSPLSLSFPSTALGSESASQTITLTNSGSAALVISQISSLDSKDFPATNTCGALPATLWVGAGCTISVNFTPATEGSLSSSISITDNASPTAQTVAVSGVGLAPEASVGPGSLSFGNQFAGTSSTAQTVTLTNNGNAALNISSIAVSSGYSLTNTCGASLAASSSCSIKVTFKPTVLGAANGTLTVTDNSNGSGSTSQTVTLTGTGIGPTAGVSPASLTFTSQMVNSTSATQNVTLNNTGTAALTITSIVIGGGNAGDFSQTNNCGASVAQNASCSISLSFKPTASGTRGATVTVTDNNNGVSGSTQVANLTGTAVAPVAAVSPSNLPAFAGTLLGTSSSAQAVTLSNTGSASLSVTAIAISGTNSSDFTQTNNCGTSVAAGANCTVNVTFKPAATGSRTASLVLTDNNNAVSSSTETVALSGTGTAPVASVSPASLPAFAGQLVGTSSPAQVLTVSNTGTAALTISSVALSGTNSADFLESSACGTSVAAGSSCTINVTFTPAATGTLSATLTVTDNNNGVSGSAQTVSLTGTGTQPAVKLSASTLSFSNENVGTASAVQPVTITNSGTAALVLTSITASGDFTVSNPCGSSLGVGASCTVNVSFKPAAVGSRTGVMTIADDAVPATQKVSLSGTGLGAEASLSVSTLTFGAELAGVTSSAQSVTLKNTGNAALTISGIAAGGDFAETNTCGSSLAAGASCTVSVTFAAKAGGARTGSLTLTDNAVGGNQTVALSGTGQDFTLTASSSSASVSPGQAASYTLTLTPSASFTESVSLACTGPTSSSETSCAVSPASISPAGATSVTVTVNTTAAAHLLPVSRPNPTLPGGQGGWLLVALAGLAAITWLARRPQVMPVRLRLTLVTASIAAILALGMTACGGGGSSSITPTPNAGTPRGNYTMTVTGSATSGAVTDSHSVALTMTVQ
ncbi:MAG TPA: choice-of-anchor D domain-containing protein [Terriglobia bacterium]|nr:choice-of-anchor D domain-containing protein [Terriglobia bacterium]